jgi:hypothetical protein
MKRAPFAHNINLSRMIHFASALRVTSQEGKIMIRIAICTVCLVSLLASSGSAQISGQLPPAAPVAAVPTARQGVSFSTLADVPQKVMFMKSDKTDPKAAIANVLLSEQGIQLITMGLAPGLMWNPYLNGAVMKAAKLGKGMILSHSNDVKGFEFDTLPGLTARSTFKPGKLELEIPLDTYRPSADFQIDGLEPVLLRLETRPKDELRVVASRQVSIKEQKKGRFDLKPTSLREETDVQERSIPIDVERRAGNILHISTHEALAQGEYAVVLRTKAANGAATQNVALKPVAVAAAPAAAPEPVDPMAAMMGMGGAPPQQPQRKGLFGGMGKSAPPAKPDAAAATNGAGFLAWDFRVIE